MKTLEQLKQEMCDRGLPGYYEVLAPFAKNAVRITLGQQSDASIPIGCSKFGGCPDLPDGVVWFRNPETEVPMSFIGQINFAETAPYDFEHKLPDHGILYFFYDCSPDGMPWGFNPEDSSGWKVFFHEGSLSALSRTDAPEDLEEDENGMVFGAARMVFNGCMELPSPESDLNNGLRFPDDEDEDLYWELIDEQSEEMINKLLGHADPVQNGMELECEYVTHQINCGTPDGYRTAKAKGLDKNAHRWNLLLQVDSNEEIGMMWGDLGRLYLWITDEDLAARNFENSWLILQCG